MKYVEKLGKSVSALGFGGAAVSGEGGGYGFGPMGEDDAIALMRAAFDSGVNLFDFAPIYGFDLAEKRAGIAFKDIREKVHLVSKCGVDWHESGRVNMTNEPQKALKMLDKTLRNFQSDYVDFYLVHWPDPRIDIRRVCEALFTAKERGKIRHIGLCNTNKEDLAKAKECAPVEVLQMEANLFAQNPLEPLGELVENSMLTMGWGAYDKGILAGTVWEGRVFDKDDCRGWAPWWKKGPWKKKAAFAREVMNRRSLSGKELSHCALARACALTDVALCGMRSKAHLNDNINFLLKTPPKDCEEVAREFALF